MTEPSPLERLEGELIDGLLTDGEHHKQWYLEEALKAVRRLIGRPFPDDLGQVTIQSEEGENSLTEMLTYWEGIAP